MTPEEIRDLLLRLADSFEQIETENAALKTILQHAVPAPGEPALGVQLADLLADARGRNAIHERYEQLRRDIREAAEERRLREILMQFPPAGRPN